MSKKNNLGEILDKINFHLCDQNPVLINEWKFYFSEQSNFHIYQDFSPDTLAGEINAIILMSDSLGHILDGDLEDFDFVLEQKIQKIIFDSKFGELVVGEALIILIDNVLSMEYKYLILAPIMRLPMNIDNTINMYLAFRAVLSQLVKFNTQQTNNSDKIKNVVCYGLDAMHEKIIAKQMFYAYSKMVNLDDKIDLDYVLWEQNDMTK